MSTDYQTDEVAIPTLEEIQEQKRLKDLEMSSDEKKYLLSHTDSGDSEVIDVDYEDGTAFHIKKVSKKQYQITSEDFDPASPPSPSPAYGTVANEVQKKRDALPAAPKETTKHIIIGVGAAILMGFLFGFLFQKSRVYDPVNIRKQFLFENFLMLKMFMGAMGASATALLFTYFYSRSMFDHIALAFHGCARRGLFKAVVLGSFMLGVGMALGGACPGMVTAQLGSLTPNSWITLLGAITGALVFGLVEPIMARWVTSGYILSKYAVYEYFPKIRFWIFAGAIVMAAVAFMIAAEFFAPWKNELRPTAQPIDFSKNIFTLYAWPPAVAGVLLGLLQFPAIFVIKDTLGSSTGYTTVCSMATHVINEQHRKAYFASFSSFRFGLLNWWQVPYLLASVLGAFVSATLSDSTWAHDEIRQTDFVLQPAAAFVGGFLMLFGSRMAGGCTSGHGISGLTLAMVNSVFAVPAMFAGGIATAFIYSAVTNTYVP